MLLGFIIEHTYDRDYLGVTPMSIVLDAFGLLISKVSVLEVNIVFLFKN